ncbi:MAG TPA: hypothetical protein VG894_09170 [Bauldia sp.]|nr:hypothetical protein [Bauldia sp.]
MRAILLAAVAALSLSATLQTAQAMKLVTLCKPMIKTAGIDETTVMNQWVAAVTQAYGQKYANFSMAKDHDISEIDLGFSKTIFVSGRPCARVYAP